MVTEELTRPQFTDLEKAIIAIAFNRVNTYGMTIAGSDIVTIVKYDDAPETFTVVHRGGSISIVNRQLLVEMIAQVRQEISAQNALGEQQPNHQVTTLSEGESRDTMRNTNDKERVFFNEGNLCVIEYIDVSDYTTWDDEGLVRVDFELGMHGISHQVEYPTIVAA